MGSTTWSWRDVVDALDKSNEQKLRDDMDGGIICDVNETVFESTIDGLTHDQTVNQMYECLLGPSSGPWGIDVLQSDHIEGAASHVVLLVDSETGESASILIEIEDN